MECFRNAAHLRPGGRFVIELGVPDLRVLPPGQDGVVFAAEAGYLGDDRRAELFRSPHRYVWPAELDLMGLLAGFDLEARHADWAGAAFTAESRTHVSVYRRPLSASPAPGPGG